MSVVHKLLHTIVFFFNWCNNMNGFKEISWHFKSLKTLFISHLRSTTFLVHYIILFFFIFYQSLLAAIGISGQSEESLLFTAGENINDLCSVVL